MAATCLLEGNTAVVLSGERNQRGPCATRPVGLFDGTAMGLPDNTLRSLAVRDGYVVDVFPDPGFRGECRTFAAGNHNLDGPWDRAVSSLVVRRAGAPLVILYSEPLYRGLVVFRGVGSYDVFQMGVPDDSVRSVTVRDAVLDVFEGNPFQGNMLTLRSGNWTFDAAWGNRISSLVVRRIGEPMAILCTEPHHRGVCSVRGVGRYGAADLGVPDNSVQSLRVRDGVVTVYDRDGFEGARVTFDAQDWTVLPVHWLKTISSIEVSAP